MISPVYFLLSGRHGLLYQATSMREGEHILTFSNVWPLHIAMYFAKLQKKTRHTSNVKSDTLFA